MCKKMYLQLILIVLVGEFTPFCCSWGGDPPWTCAEALNSTTQNSSGLTGTPIQASAGGWPNYISTCKQISCTTVSATVVTLSASCSYSLGNHTYWEDSSMNLSLYDAGCNIENYYGALTSYDGDYYNPPTCEL